MSKKTYHHGNLSEELVLAAVKLLEEEGMNALSLRRVAKEVGVSQAAPYAHFKDKKALLAAVAGEGFRRFENMMQTYAKQENDYIIGLGMGYVLFSFQNPSLFNLMFNDDLVDTGLLEVCEYSFGSSYEMLLDGISAHPLRQFSEQNPEFDAVFLWSLVHGLANLMLARRVKGETYGFKDESIFIRSVLTKYIGHTGIKD